MFPVQLVRNEEVVEYPVVQASLTRRYTDLALHFMETHRDRPFFVYLAHAMPHKPLAASDDFYTPESREDLYADVIAELDHSVGRILERLDDLGLSEETLVIFTSDNGPWYGGSTGGLRGMKGKTWEGGLRVPLIARGPGVPEGKTVAEPVSTLDIGPTILDYARREPLLAVQHGATLRPVIEGDASRDYALNEWELLPARTGVALSLRTVRTKTRKLTVDLRSGAGELYDLANDPEETRNLFDARESAGMRRELEAMLAERPDDIGPNRAPVGIA